MAHLLIDYRHRPAFWGSVGMNDLSSKYESVGRNSKETIVRIIDMFHGTSRCGVAATIATLKQEHSGM